MRSVDHIAAMAAYGLAPVPAPGAVSLAQNESLRPPSPKAIAAGAQAMAQSALYPNADWRHLRHVLADLHGVDPASILCGAGSLDLIGGLAQCYAGPTRAVLAPRHAYPFFRTAAQIAGARFDLADEVDSAVDVDALISALRPDTALVFVANPGNPTGTRIPSDDIRRLRAAMGENTLLVVDEAYGEFADHLGDPVWDMVAEGKTVVLRTFSKAYGLAGARVGWGAFPAPIAQEMRKVLNPNNISVSSQAAATAAAEDQAYMRETCAMTAELRRAAVQQLAEFGVRDSLTNFLLLDCGDADRANALLKHCADQGILLRAQAGAGLPHAVRITIGTQDVMGRAAAAIANFELGGRT